MAEVITRYVKLAIGFVLLWIVAYAYNNIGCRRVAGPEMEPTIAGDTFKWISPGKPLEEIGRSDFVFYEWERPGENRSGFAARVIGLPGDRVKLEKGEVFVNGTKVEQSYVAGTMTDGYTMEEIVVPRDSLFVLMDNRRSSARLDSRGIGPVGRRAVAGTIRP